jgi:hypothetical protein
VLAGHGVQEQYSRMAARSPRHLAVRPKRNGASLRVVFLAALLALALLTAVIALAIGEADDAGRRAATPATSAPRATATPTTAAATTAPAAPTTRPTPGNLLRGADFERDLAGWTPLGGARLERVEGGTSGRWAVAVQPSEGADGPAALGLAIRDLASAKAGTVYEASVWVRATVPGGQVVLALHEERGGRAASSDTAAYGLPDDDWRQLAVEHRARVGGSSLALEITGANLPGEGRLLVDLVDVQVE